MARLLIIQGVLSEQIGSGVALGGVATLRGGVVMGR
jgi:hypothetical protein